MFLLQRIQSAMPDHDASVLWQVFESSKLEDELIDLRGKLEMTELFVHQVDHYIHL